MSFPLVRVLSAPRRGLAVAAVVACATLAPALDLDPAIPAYQPVAGIAGNLNSIGSDTLSNLLSYWTEGFKAVYPNVKIQIQSPGSGAAPQALLEGTAQIGPMSREMTPGEVDKFEKKFGYKPTALRVSIDALAIFVHKDNPIAALSLKQADSIFSSTFKRGGTDITAWSALGVAGWEGKAISLYGRNSISGTYSYFKEHTLKKGDFKATVKEQSGSSAVVQGISGDVTGIGYSGIGYVTSGVKALPLIEKDGGSPVEPTYANCLNSTYPLARFLFIYVNKKPGEPLQPLVGEFLKFVLVKDGQEIVIKDGYYPLTAELSKAGLESIK